MWLWISGFAVGGGGGGAWLMVVDEGFSVGGGGAKFEDADSNHILLCSVSGWVHHFGKK